MKTAYITLPNDVIEKVNSVHHVDFRPTHVVIHMKDGNIVAYQAIDVKIVVTQETE